MAAALPAIAIASVVGGGAMSAIGSVKSGNANYQAGMYQAAIADQNAQRSEYQAKEAIQQGAVDEMNARRNAAGAAGEQRAALAGLGQLLGVGSAASIIQDTNVQGSIDALTARQNAQKQALGFNLQASDFRNEGQLDRMGASSARTAGLINAGGTLLSTGGRAASMQYNFNQTSFKKPGGG